MRNPVRCNRIYQHGRESQLLPFLYVADAIVKEYLKKLKQDIDKFPKLKLNYRVHVNEVWHPLTVVWGLMLANLKACSNASSNGLQSIGVLGSIEPISDWHGLSKFSLPNWTSFLSSNLQLVLSLGLRVSKHIILSKQSSNPSFLRVFDTWALSAFEKICKQKFQVLRTLSKCEESHAL